MRVIVADDAMLTRVGIVQLLRATGVNVVAEVGDADALLRETALRSPDVVVVDIRMPPTHRQEGLVAASRIRNQHPDTGVLVLSQYVEPAYAWQLLSEHPTKMGYLLKDRVSDPAVLVDALRRLDEGESVIDPTIVSVLMHRARHRDPIDALTPREREVLSHVAEGLSNREIASRLHITERTVEAHITAVFDKLGLTDDPTRHRRVQAVLSLLRTED
jgi:DNA-binding NarL/FixJ family response regulator